MGLKKVLFGGLFTVALFIVGFIFLLRGCLAKYDERSVIAPALAFEHNGQTIIFSIVKYDKTTSYSQRGGFISKSVNTKYYLQTNEAAGAKRTALQKVMDHSDIKHWPVETIAAANNLAWVFMNELMAFDPYTLQKKADKAILEARNPQLKNKLPDERRYYQFNPADNHIYFTANDGIKWQLNTATLTATTTEVVLDKDPVTAIIDQVEKLQQHNRNAQDSLYLQEYPGKLYAAGKINRQQYQAAQTAYFKKRDRLYKERDSLQNVLSVLRTSESAQRQQRSAIENLQRLRLSFAQIRTNQDTTQDGWWGMYSREEMEKLHNRVQMQSAYDETARRQLYRTSYTASNYGYYTIDKENAANPLPNQYFLQGGFLLDKRTATPIRLAGSHDYLIVYKDKIGNEGKIILGRLNKDGKITWTFETGLTEWITWLYTGSHLLVFGTDNKELSGDECNVLYSVDLSSGKANRYDYFTDRE
jgi:hypothetical protein